MKKSVGITLCIIITFITSGIIIHNSMLDGLDGLFWSLGFKEDTVYSPKYSDNAFKQINIGMSEAEVKRLLGEPIETYPPDKWRDSKSLRYSHSPGDTHYRIRNINVKDGIVISKYSEFYVD